MGTLFQGEPVKIPVLGMDPSMTAWGLAYAELDLQTGILDTPQLDLIEPEKLKHKQVRQNSKDLWVAEQLHKEVFDYASRAKVIFAEVPVGSQSARGMCAYGVCVGILGSLRSQGIQVIEVTASEVKLALAGHKHATKDQMITAAVAEYPDANYPVWRGEMTQKAEHVADAIGAIHAGVRTPIFQNLMRLFKEV